MSQDQRVVYEVNLEIRPSRRDEFDDWLREHVHDVLAQPGFVEAEIRADEETGPDGTVRRTVCYWLENRPALENYLAGPAEALRADGVRRFGDDLRAWRRIGQVIGRPR